MVIRKSIAVLIVFSVCTAFAQEGLRPGVQAPDFTLPAATSAGVLPKQFQLSELRGRTVVLAFFFKARTSG